MGVIDGGRRPVTATASEPTTGLVLARADFAALVSRRHPTAFAIKRRIARIGCARVRGQLTKLADSLGGGAPPDVAADAELEFRGPPDSRYVGRLANFRAFDSLALPAPVTAITRERTLVLALPTAAFERLVNGAQPESHVFLDVIHRDLTGSLRQALRPHARLAVSL